MYSQELQSYIEQIESVPVINKSKLNRRSVLCLDVTYQPDAVVTVRKAVGYVFREIARIVEVEDDEWIYASTFKIPTPSVISFKKYDKRRVEQNRSDKYAFTKNRVRIRDKNICLYCGDRATEVDHVVPLSRGGKNDWLNVVASCSLCNRYKDDHLPEEKNMKLMYQPYVPTHRDVLLDLAESIDNPKWSNYI